MQAVPNFSTAMLDAGKSMKLIQETVADVLKVGPPFVTLISSIAENEIQVLSFEFGIRCILIQFIYKYLGPILNEWWKFEIGRTILNEQKRK